ncbi:Cu(I)-responsive transcriptional regulator [Daeguia caeni]|uniref:Cu(I)-responsive transcriptional regulator n=1 Tax=Daeguia caeni TaxID=439612 RepID=A0ABV9H361_9HYPH
MNIGEAASASGISAKMIRHYETIGLIEAAGRTASGYRVYGHDEVETLRFIRRSRDLGFSVEQIRTLLSLWRDRNRSSADVKRVALQHIAEIEDRMRALAAMADTLRHLAETCQGDDQPDCPILHRLTQAEPACYTRPDRRKGALLHNEL